MVVVVLA